MFEGENIYEFRNFNAICKNFLHEIWACCTHLWLVLAFRKVFSMKWSLLIDLWKLFPSKVPHYMVIKYKLMHFYILPDERRQHWRQRRQSCSRPEAEAWLHPLVDHVLLFFLYKCTYKHNLGWSNNNKCTCTYTMCVHVHVHVWIYAWIADLPSVSNRSSAPTCTKNYDTK